MIEVIDNFLPEEEFNSIQSFMMGGEFKWFYANGRAFADDGEFHMTHMFFQPEVGSNSEHLNMWNNFMQQVGAKKCERIKANLMFKTPTSVSSIFHTDYPDMKTAVFYINTNNGCTEFENGVRVKSVANRYLSFDTSLNHRAISCTDELRRIVVNFNYA